MKLEIKIDGEIPLREITTTGAMSHTIETAGGPTVSALTAEHHDPFVLLDQAERFLGGALGYGPEDQFPSTARALNMADELRSKLSLAEAVRDQHESRTTVARGEKQEALTRARMAEGRSNAALDAIKQLEGIAALTASRWPRGLRQTIKNLRDDSFDWRG